MFNSQKECASYCHKIPKITILLMQIVARVSDQKAKSTKREEQAF